MGMRVIAIDGGEDKRKLCIDKLGAEKYIDFQEEKDIPGKVTEMTKVSFRLSNMRLPGADIDGSMVLMEPSFSLLPRHPTLLLLTSYDLVALWWR